MIKKYKKFIESKSTTYSEYVSDLSDYLIRMIGLTEDQTIDYINYFEGKDYIYDCWENGYTIKDCVDSLRIDGKIKWFK